MRLLSFLVVMNVSQVEAEDVFSCFTPLTSPIPRSPPRRPGPPVRSTKIDRGPRCCVSTRPPPVSINTRLHAWHNLLKQNCLYFLTQLLPWLCSPNQLYFTVGCVLCVWHCAIVRDGEQAPGWLPQSSKDGSHLLSLSKRLQTETQRPQQEIWRSFVSGLWPRWEIWRNEKWISLPQKQQRRRCYSGMKQKTCIYDLILQRNNCPSPLPPPTTHHGLCLHTLDSAPASAQSPLHPHFKMTFPQQYSSLLSPSSFLW